MSPQAGFLLQDQIVPRLISCIPQAVSFIGSEDAQELVQDATLIAAQMIHGAEQAGKKVVRNPGAGRRGARTVKTISAGNVAFYTIQKLKCGRRSTGSSTVNVYGSGTQINGTTRLTSLNEAAPVLGIDDVGEPLALHDLLSNDQEDPETKAARKMDWDTFMAALSEREKLVVLQTIEGKCGAAIARALKTSASTVQNSKHHLAAKIQDYMGSDILIQIRRKPNWKDNLDASRERLACREERRHL
jgi:hypothetical protein